MTTVQKCEVHVTDAFSSKTINIINITDTKRILTAFTYIFYYYFNFNNKVTRCTKSSHNAYLIMLEGPYT